MASKDRREREKTELRARIMDAARDIFAREGFEAVSMRRLADAIEYSPTAIYAYFQDKEDLFRQICMDDFDRFQQNQAAAMEIKDPVVRIAEMGKAYIRFALEHPNHFRRMFLDPPNVSLSEEQIARRGDPSKDGYAFFRNNVAEAVAAKRFRDDLGENVELITQTLWAAVHGVAAIQTVHGDDDAWVKLEPVQKRIDTMVDAILRGMLKDENATARDKRETRGAK